MEILNLGIFIQTIIIVYESGNAHSLNLNEGVVSLLEEFNCHKVMGLSKDT
jgi:hypothetical protein